MNVLSYIIYLFVSCVITVYTGRLFYKNGRIYLLNLFQKDERLTDFINKILLTGYYLLNLGYVALMIRFWKTIGSWAELMAGVTNMTGTIMLTLGVIHFFNMAVIYFIGKRNNLHYIHHTTTFL
jgi:hypothetical protein